jgi:hypothetical protein
MARLDVGYIWGKPEHSSSSYTVNTDFCLRMVM